VALSKMQKDAIESRLFELVSNTFNFITNKTCEIKIIEKTEDNQSQTIVEEKTDFINTENYSNSFLNPKYTFDNPSGYVRISPFIFAANISIPPIC
ncbi:MAG: hypothetical protein IIX07_05855, partial [Lachnospiraceae bacterium]|nr:hypothetical protein [Lachnospiraceae bacterium]